MIAIQINVHGQESIESVIPKTLKSFIELQSNLQCDIRQQYKSAVLRNHGHRYNDSTIITLNKLWTVKFEVKNIKN
ncbi:hypothetical protein BLOT_014184, partial [Blomia tropicalis]